MFINFITALAWLFGGFQAIAFLIQFVPPVNGADVSRAFRIAVIGFVPWAWLVARYLL